MGESYARCTVCQSSFSIAHGGANDCATHVNGARHRKYADTMSGQASINTFFVQKRSDEADKVTRAELLWTEFLTEHNIPVSVSDHFGPLFKQMFPDSQIANKFTCGHTKAASLRTQFRPTMSAKTVESICVNKTKKGECYKQTYTDSQLQRARGATKRSLEAAGDS